MLISGMPASASSDAGALDRLQALVEQEVGERDGDDREQAAEHGDEAQQAAGGGDRERGVGAGVEQADDARGSGSALSGARARARSDEQRPGSGTATTRAAADAGERVVLGGAVEEDEREADAERGDERELERLALRPRRRRRARRLASTTPASAATIADPLQRARALAVERRPPATGTIALVATIGATMLIVPSASAR